jgi:hypothetical protein
LARDRQLRDPEKLSAFVIGIARNLLNKHLHGLSTTVVDSDNQKLLWTLVLRSLPWRSDYRGGSVSCCGRIA